MLKNKILAEIVKILNEKKGEDIIILDMRKLTTITDYFVIVTAASNTHLRAIAKECIEKINEKFKVMPLNPFNPKDERWILIDYQDIILHIFLDEARKFYNLEDLWHEAKRVKI